MTASTSLGSGVITLREYQTRAIEEGRAAFRRGCRAVLLVSPTGSGKTTIGSAIVQNAVAKGLRCAWFAHRVELVTQAAKTLRGFGLRVGPGEAVEVLSTQAVTSGGRAPKADLVVLDEAHHYVSTDWKRIPDAYRAGGASIVGLTATPERADGLGLAGSFDSLVVVSQIGELTELGHLARAELVVPRGTVGKDTISEDPWRVYAKYGAGRSCVVFAPNVDSAEAFAADFRKARYSAAVVEANTPADKRAEILDRFKEGEISVLCNVAVLTEGWDAPRCKVAILARKIGSPSLYLQMGGRILRPWNDVTPTLIDLAGNVELHGDLTEERTWSLDGAACTRKGERDGVRYCKVCHTEIPADAEFCPNVACARPVSEVAIPHATHMEMMRLERVQKRDQWAAGLKPDKRRKLLAGLYVKGIKSGWQRGAAEHRFSAVMKYRPDAALKQSAWLEAQATIAEEKGDAWEHEESPTL